MVILPRYKYKITEQEMKKLPQYEKQAKEVFKQITKLQREYDTLNEKVGALSQITDFYLGVPLIIKQNSPYLTEVTIASPETERYARIYHNANHPKKDLWGIHTYESLWGGKGELWHGADFTGESALDLAKNWVVKGERPED